MKGFFLALVAFLATTSAASAKESVDPDAEVASCASVTDDKVYAACLDRIEAACADSPRRSRRECEAVVQTARAEFERDKARAQLAAVLGRSASTAESDRTVATVATASLELPTRRPRELVVTTVPPPGFSQCGSCWQLYGLGVDRLAFYVDGELASVVDASGGLDTVVADLDGNGEIDAAEQVGVDIADGRKVPAVYLTLRPGQVHRVKVVRLQLDATIPGRVYVPIWSATHQLDATQGATTPRKKNVINGF